MKSNKQVIMQTDFKYLKSKPISKRRFNNRHWLASGLVAIGAMLIVTLALASWSEPKAVETTVQLPSPQLTPVRPWEPVENSYEWREVKIKRGDTFAALMRKNGVSQETLTEILGLGRSIRPLHRLRAGDTLKLQFDVDDSLLSLAYPRDETKTIVLERNDSGVFELKELEKHFETRIAYATGSIDSSLFEAGQQAGMSNLLIMEMARIFGWDIDFALEVRRGDHFTVMYEQMFHQGEKVRDGKILAAEFVNRGKSYQAVLFTDNKGRSRYYTPDGRSMRKAFLRTPVKFSRISSRFSLGRRHPILNRIRAHRGVDYAAPRGTPIRATGNGRIIHRGRKGGYGKTVIIKHGRYTTLYAHMSRYSRRAKRGARIRQGQVIGYIGSTGLATGPHLHYEFRVNGKHRDPLKVRLPKAPPIAKKYRAMFDEQSNRLLAQLDLIKRNYIAMNP